MLRSALRSTRLTRRCAHSIVAETTPCSQRWSSLAHRPYTSSSASTGLEGIIHNAIQTTGPMSFATYMQLCLSHPNFGYYTRSENPILGAEGDFTTSPEISQIFGELVAVWLQAQWLLSTKTAQAEKPPSIRLIELGPGRGTLLDDILRVFNQFSRITGASIRDVHLVETSPVMRALQEEKLRRQHYSIGSAAPPTFSWHDSIEQIPARSEHGDYTMLIAHEFFDALPIHIIEKREQGWHEALISSSTDPILPTVLDASGKVTTSSPPSLTFKPGLSPIPTARANLLGLSSPRFRALPLGSRIEVAPTGFKIARRVAELLTGCSEVTATAASDGSAQVGKGCALIVDYGDEKAYGNSIRAFKDHRIVDIFHRPGECDITANVDFAYLKEAMNDLVTTSSTLPQATFLNAMGLGARVEALQRAATSDERREMIADGAGRLVDTTEMGRQYRVLGVTTKEVALEWPFGKVEVEGAQKRGGAAPASKAR